MLQGLSRPLVTVSMAQVGKCCCVAHFDVYVCVWGGVGCVGACVRACVCVCVHGTLVGTFHMVVPWRGS